MEPMLAAVLWIVIVGFIIAFILAFGIGANDVANSFGTSVGSGVLTIRQACWLATFCEVSGAVLIGYKVSDTMRKGILDTSLYHGAEYELMLGCLAALASSAIWLLVATFLKLPISGTHSIVGSTIGYSMVARGTNGLQWIKLGTIVGSWFISPVLSGFVSVILFWIIRRYILNARNSFKAGLMALPIFYGVTVFVNVFSIMNDGPKLLYMDNIPLYIAVVASLAIALLIAVLVQTVIVPWMRKKITRETGGGKAKFTFGDSDDSSNNGSPRRQKRPVSIVCDGKQLPAITEITELVSLNNGCCTPSAAQSNGWRPYSSALSNTTTTTTNATIITSTSTPCTTTITSTTTNNGNPCKFDPVIRAKAEHLLGKVSLDGPDLTVSSLNFIDDAYANSLTRRSATCSNYNKIQTIQDFFNRKNSLRSPEPPIKTISTTIQNESTLMINGKLGSPKPPLADITTEFAIPPTIMVDDDLAKPLPPPPVSANDSAVSLDGMASQALLPNNSSKVPLIESKENLLRHRQAKNEETEEVSKLFSFLQIMTASFGSFAHGGNDVSNAIGPLIALWLIYQEGSVAQTAETPLSILLFGGVGISVGLWVWGRRVIKTVGNDLTKITPSTGFTIEIGAALTVLLASKIGLPISTTHCKVGSVVFVGYAAGDQAGDGANNDLENGLNNNEPRKGAVDWSLFRNIVYAWIVTVPVAALLSAGIMFVLLKVVPPVQ